MQEENSAAALLTHPGGRASSECLRKAHLPSRVSSGNSSGNVIGVQFGECSLPSVTPLGSPREKEHRRLVCNAVPQPPGSNMWIASPGPTSLVP